MGKLIVIAGSNGSGKTTLATALGEQPGITPYYESHADRPFQALFARDVHRYALPNQIDYLLRRAEQERQIRGAGVTGVQDGGLEQDYHLYTRLFHHKGFLDDREFDLCRRTYLSLRAGQPAPDLIVWLRAPHNLLHQRLQNRARMIDLQQIVTLEDLPLLDAYLVEWMSAIPQERLLEIYVTAQDEIFFQAVESILEKLG